MVYVLKGWLVSEFEGKGAIRMETGSCWLQPNGIRHAVLDYSDDCEILEIVMPANFDTENLT
jgi:quercetin dioxygenase-like cupin family protein